MSTRKKTAPARKAASTSRSASTTKATSRTATTRAKAGKAVPKDKRRVWDYIKKNDLQDKAKRSL